MKKEKSKKPNWRDSIDVWKDDPEADKIFDGILKERCRVSKRRKRTLKW